MARNFPWRRPPLGVGVDFGCAGVKAVALTNDGGRISLAAAGREDLPPGAVQDGTVRDPEQVGSALGALLRRLGVRSRLLGLAIGGSSLLVKRFPAPRDLVAAPELAPGAFRAAVAREAARHVPFHLESLEFDYEGPMPAPPGAGPDEEPGAIIFGAAPRETVQNHCRAAQAAGYEAAGIELEPYALFAAAGLESESDENEPETLPLAIVEVGASRAGVHIFRHGPPRAALSGSEGSAPADESRAGDLLVSVLAPGAGALGADAVSTPAAPFRTAPTGGSGDVPGANGPGGGAEPGVFVNRLVATLREALGEAGVASEGRLLVSGGGAVLPGLHDRLREVEFGEPVLLDPLGPLGFGEPGPPYAVAAGLAWQQLLDRSGAAAARDRKP